MKFFLKCNEAANVCDKSQYEEAGFFEKVMLKMHLVMCKFCRGYSKSNTKLTKTIKSANIKTLRPEEKQTLKTRVQQEINNEQHS
jgi:predicted anti-sigma-YlaC factor YlaD